MNQAMFKAVCSFAAVTMLFACGKKDEEATLQPIVFPAATEAGTIDALAAPAGNYKVSKVRSYATMTEGQAKGRMLFSHSFRTPGAPLKGDPFGAPTEFSGFDKKVKKFKISVDINLPMEMKATGTNLTFSNKQNYYQTASSDDSYRWWVSGEESFEGSPFYELLKPAFRKDKVFSMALGAGSGRMIGKLEGTNLVLFLELKNTSGEQKMEAVLEITYVKQ